MKSWLARFRVSSAFDNNRPLPHSLRRQLKKSQELRNFAGRLSELDSALRKSPACQAPDTLHSSIMGVVRAVERAEWVAPKPVYWLRRVPAPALTGLAICALWWLSLPSPGNRPVPSVTAALETGEQLTEVLPTQLMDPLNEEWRRVNLDLENTTRFLQASVPFSP